MPYTHYASDVLVTVRATSDVAVTLILVHASGYLFGAKYAVTLCTWEFIKG